jgi:hypothetical protein
MFSLEPLDQVGHGRGGALVLDHAQRVAAVLDVPAQLTRLVAGRRAAPDRGVADGIGALTTGPGCVAQGKGAKSRPRIPGLRSSNNEGENSP